MPVNCIFVWRKRKKSVLYRSVRQKISCFSLHFIFMALFTTARSWIRTKATLPRSSMRFFLSAFPTTLYEPPVSHVLHKSNSLFYLCNSIWRKVNIMNSIRISLLHKFTFSLLRPHNLLSTSISVILNLLLFLRARRQVLTVMKTGNKIRFLYK